LKLLNEARKTEKIIDDLPLAKGTHSPPLPTAKKSFQFLTSPSKKSQGLRKIKGCSEEKQLKLPAAQFLGVDRRV